MRKNNKPVILYILIAFLVITIAAGCDYASSEHEHAFDFNEVSEMGHEETELIYRYHPSCGACQSIESEVDDFADDNVQNIPLHKVHVSHEENLPDGLIGGVPTLLVVENGEITEEFVGAVDIPEFFNDVNSGDYPVN